MKKNPLRRLVYIVASIVILGLIIFWFTDKKQIEAHAEDRTNQSLSISRKSLVSFLKTQENAAELLGLAKRVNNSQPELVQLIIDRAYAIDPNNSDVVYMASFYHPELKEKALELNPLQGVIINSNSPLSQKP